MRGGGHAAKSVLLFRIDFGADLGVPGGRFDRKVAKKGLIFGWTFWKTLWKRGAGVEFLRLWLVEFDSAKASGCL